MILQTRNNKSLIPIAIGIKLFLLVLVVSSWSFTTVDNAVVTERQQRASVADEAKTDLANQENFFTNRFVSKKAKS